MQQNNFGKYSEHYAMKKKTFKIVMHFLTFTCLMTVGAVKTINSRRENYLAEAALFSLYILEYKSSLPY